MLYDKTRSDIKIPGIKTLDIMTPGIFIPWTKRRHETLFVLVTILLSFVFIGWGGNLEEVQKSASTIRTIQADFTQKKHMKILLRPLVSKGSLSFKAPRSLRWEYASPVKNVLLVSGDKIRRFVKKGDGIIEDKSAGLQMMQFVMSEITMWLSGRFDTNPAFKTDFAGAGKIVLTPKEKSFSAMIGRIELNLGDRPGVIKSVSIYENEDSYTMLEFTNTILNGEIKESVFREFQ